MSSKGQSVIEIIVAISIMVMIAAGAVSAVLGSFNSSRLAKEESQASIISATGLEAVRSIRDQSWANLSTGNHGLSSTGGNWAFSGSSDQDQSLKFTRTITVTDGPGADTKTILSSVVWDFTPSRHNTVAMTLLLTDWQRSKSSAAGSGASSCSAYCLSQSYLSGICRANLTQCTNNVETHVSAGDVFCTAPPADFCCCK